MGTSVTSTSPRPAPLIVDDVRFAYGSQQALRGVSFQVTAGEVFGLLGPNGGGKSTLFRLITTLLPVTQGRISVCGIDLQQSPAQARACLGVTFQSPSLDGRLTVAENLQHQGHLYGLRGKTLAERVRQVSGWLGLGERRSQRAEELSGGLKRRVEIAKSLLHAPRLLILDEPSTGIDPGARLDLWTILDTIRREQGVTIVVTTHLMDEAERCDRLGLLDEGQLVALGTPAELRASLGGEILTITSSDPDRLTSLIQERWSITPQRLGNELKLSTTQGLELLRELAIQGSTEISAISLARPNLEDVFVQKTGRRLHEGQGADAV